VGERRPVIIIVGSIAVVLALVLGWAFAPSAEDEAAAAPLTETTDPAAIQDQVQLSRISIATSENFARQKIRVISGLLTNVSDKPLRMADVKMVFTDYDGKPVYEYTDPVLERRQKPVAPGAEYRFEVRLENLPRNWNFRIPITEVVKIGH
jgi:hypothetical protein